MKIAIVGVGYVGLVTGACFAELGSTVYCIDNDSEKIHALKQKRIPIYEPNLDRLVERNVKAQRLYFTTDLTTILHEVEIVFIAVGTPMNSDGSADLTAVIAVAKIIGENLQNYILVVNKSTVPVGTAKKVRDTIQKELTARRLQNLTFDVASNPEFLKEGAAIDDFMKPDRVIVGTDSQQAKDLLTQLYKPMLLNNFRVIFMDIPSAEMTKYAANAMLATRISFMNELANLCERVGADIANVRAGIGSDTRIGNRFLYAGCGYGGSCLPKDVSALLQTAQENDAPLQLLKTVQQVNELQKERLFEKFRAYYKGNIHGYRVAIWGLAFKPETDDIREAPALQLIKRLQEVHCSITVYDPVAMTNAQKLLGNTVRYATDLYDAVKDAQVLFHVTEWKEFRMPDWNRIRNLMHTPLLIDGRNVFDKNALDGFTYLQIGR